MRHCSICELRDCGYSRVGGAEASPHREQEEGTGAPGQPRRFLLEDRDKVHGNYSNIPGLACAPNKATSSAACRRASRALPARQGNLNLIRGVSPTRRSCNIARRIALPPAGRDPLSPPLASRPTVPSHLLQPARCLGKCQSAARAAAIPPPPQRSSAPPR